MLRQMMMMMMMMMMRMMRLPRFVRQEATAELISGPVPPGGVGCCLWPQLNIMLFGFSPFITLCSLLAFVLIYFLDCFCVSSFSGWFCVDFPCSLYIM